jgi:hypothetical protein
LCKLQVEQDTVRWLESTCLARVTGVHSPSRACAWCFNLQTLANQTNPTSLSLGCIHPQPPQTGELSFGFAHVVQGDFKLQ